MNELTLSAKTPEAEKFKTKGPRTFTVDEIRNARRTWARLDGFSGETCGDCGATANVLAFSPGWHCSCGHFNVQSYSHHQMAHASPDFGPSAAVIEAGYVDDVSPSENGGDGKGSCGCK